MNGVLPTSETEWAVFHAEQDLRRSGVEPTPDRLTAALPDLSPLAVRRAARRLESRRVDADEAATLARVAAEALAARETKIEVREILFARLRDPLDIMACVEGGDLEEVCRGIIATWDGLLS